MLGRVLSSETFRRSERARSLLTYLVDREQAGDAERLKGYAIAVDVFGKAAEFDASTDAVVRVQAGRLRELLSQYYESEGSAEPVRIVVPRGSYAPAYEKVGPCPKQAAAQPEAEEPAADTVAPEPTASEPIASGPAAPEPADPPLPIAPAEGAARPLDGALPERGAAMGQVRLLWVALTAVAALLLVFVYRTSPIWHHGTADAAAPTRNVRAADARPADALPTIRIVAKDNSTAVTAVARHFRTAFAGFDALDLIGGEFLSGEVRLPAEATGFVLSIASGASPGDVLVELQNLGSGKVLLNRVLTAEETAPEAVEDVVANVATSVAPVTGVIYGYLKENELKSPLVECLTLSDAYYTEQTPAKHAAAYKCLEKLAGTQGESSLVYSELAGLHQEARTDAYRYPSDPTDDQAMVLARKAIQLAPTSPYAHRAVGFLYSRRGDRIESVRWMRKAYELNTYDLSMAASYGYALVFATDYLEGAAILERAVEASSAHPSWWDYTLFLARFMLDDMDQASRATDALVAPTKSQYLAARLIVAHWRGDERSAGSLATRLSATYPKFAADPAAVLREAKYPADLAGKLVDALKTAGFGGAS